MWNPPTKEAIELAAKGSFRCKIDTLDRKKTEKGFDEEQHDEAIRKICTMFLVDAQVFFGACEVLAGLSAKK